MTTRSWRVDGGASLLLLRHEPRRGTMKLYVNGRLAHCREGAALDASCELLCFQGWGISGTQQQQHSLQGARTVPPFGDWEVRVGEDCRPPTQPSGLLLSDPHTVLWRLLVVDFPGLREFTLTANGGAPLPEDGDTTALVEEQQRLRVQVGLPSMLFRAALHYVLRCDTACYPAELCHFPWNLLTRSLAYVLASSCWHAPAGARVGIWQWRGKCERGWRVAAAGITAAHRTCGRRLVLFATAVAATSFAVNTSAVSHQNCECDRRRR